MKKIEDILSKQTLFFWRKKPDEDVKPFTNMIRMKEEKRKKKEKQRKKRYRNKFQ